MGWVTRPSGRRYLYRSVRQGGRVVREYLGKDDPFGWLMADELGLKRADALQARQVVAAARERVMRRVARLEGLAGGDALAAVCHGLMLGLGFHRHHRGEWRMRRELKDLRKKVEALKAAVDLPRPLIKYQAPADDAEAAAVFAAARAGDKEAVAKLPALIRDRGWAESMGDLGRQAGQQLLNRVAQSDPVMTAGVRAKVAELWKELAGDRPTVLETLLVRRVVNGWLLTHAVEIELALTTDPGTVNRLDRMLTRSQGRMAQAIRELAVVRRLQVPAVMAKLQLNVAGNQTLSGQPDRDHLSRTDFRPNLTSLS